jgi:hypothetical protein
MADRPRVSVFIPVYNRAALRRVLGRMGRRALVTESPALPKRAVPTVDSR